jgi:hypothetical protein
MVIGLFVYFLYGRAHSYLNKPELAETVKVAQ